ncbi:MAG: hypothetical protein DMG39_10730 [Acidobacteria bacterium]|nr:MAG: hypothetical protein DMG39_10730 [Acidobacteriota bacterium]
MIFYSESIEFDVPCSTLREVHWLYFEPEKQEFSPRTMWSLSNAFSSAFKKLDTVPLFKASAKLGEFLTQLAAGSGKVSVADHSPGTPQTTLPRVLTTSGLGL